ncbi:MAG: hypothetical protein GWN64_12750 [Candidatus Thorarchaeota archaeon]|nr:hypothetical protein [Candidatus Thorarchaeota archaeon]
MNQNKEEVKEEQTFAEKLAAIPHWSEDLPEEDKPKNVVDEKLKEEDEKAEEKEVEKEKEEVVEEGEDTREDDEDEDEEESSLDEDDASISKKELDTIMQNLNKHAEIISKHMGQEAKGQEREEKELAKPTERKPIEVPLFDNEDLNEIDEEEGLTAKVVTKAFNRGMQTYAQMLFEQLYTHLSSDFEEKMNLRDSLSAMYQARPAFGEHRDLVGMLAKSLRMENPKISSQEMVKAIEKSLGGLVSAKGGGNNKKKVKGKKPTFVKGGGAKIKSDSPKLTGQAALIAEHSRRRI